MLLLFTSFRYDITIFDLKVSFDEHLKSVLKKKISKAVGLLRKFQSILPRTSLITIYKLFAKIESIQYNAAIAITGAIRSTASEKLYQELRLESLRSREWLRKPCLFYKIYKNKSPSYLCNLIPDSEVLFYSKQSNR